MPSRFQNPDLIEVESVFRAHQRGFKFSILRELLKSDGVSVCYGKEKKDRFREDDAIISLNLNMQGISTHRIARFCGISQGAVHKRVKKGVRMLKERFPEIQSRMKEKKEMIMMKLYVRSHFDAAHRLDYIDGPCSTLHGHRWRVECEFQAPLDRASGLAEDFHHLKNIINGNLPDHSFLNKKAEIENPTAENIARYLFGLVSADLKHLKSRASLLSITVWESDDCAAKYEGGK